jgi:hypothetical protein
VNSFNVISASPTEIAIQILEYDRAQQTYTSADETTFPRNVR